MVDPSEYTIVVNPDGTLKEVKTSGLEADQQPMKVIIGEDGVFRLVKASEVLQPVVAQITEQVIKNAPVVTPLTEQM